MADTTSADGAAAAWEKHLDDATQAPYYHNRVTGETTWDRPDDFVEPADDEEDAADQDQEADATPAPALEARPARWVKFIDDRSGTPYYFDEANDRTQWEEPDGFVEDADAAAEDEEPPEEEGQTNDDGEDAEAPEPTSAASRDAAEHDADTSSSAPEAAREAPPTDAKTNWVRHMDPASNKPYYHDTVSGKTQWEQPDTFTDAPTQSAAMSADYLDYVRRSRAERLANVSRHALDPQGHLSRLNAILEGIGGGDADTPEDQADGDSAPVKAEWQQHVDPRNKRCYYHNIVTGVTQWEKPDAPIVSAVADWIPPEALEESGKPKLPLVSGESFIARAKFNRVTGKYEKLGGEDYWHAMGAASDRAGRQMSHFFDTSQMEQNREQAKRMKEELKRKNVDWKKVAAEKKAKKMKQKNDWLYRD